MEYLGIDWSYRRAAWCALSDAGTIVGEDCIIAEDCVLHANAVLYARSMVGARTIIHSGAVIVGEGAVPADEDGLARLVIDRRVDVRAVVEMMSGAIWVRDTLTAAGWGVQIAHARKVRDVAPLGVQDRQGRRQGAGRAVPPRPGPCAVGALA